MPKVTLTTGFQASLPYIFEGLLPLPLVLNRSPQYAVRIIDEPLEDAGYGALP
jgi:hypothetical protein